VDARIVVASVDTYPKFAEAVNRLDPGETKEATTFPDLVEGGTERAGEGSASAPPGSCRNASPPAAQPPRGPVG